MSYVINVHNMVYLICIFVMVENFESTCLRMNVIPMVQYWCGRLVWKSLHLHPYLTRTMGLIFIIKADLLYKFIFISILWSPWLQLRITWFWTATWPSKRAYPFCPVSQQKHKQKSQRINHEAKKNPFILLHTRKIDFILVSLGWYSQKERSLLLQALT